MNRAPRRRRAFSDRPRVVAIVVAVVVLAAGGAWLLLRAGGGEQPTAGAAAGDTAEASTAAADSAPPLPPLAESDSLVREMVTRLSARPELAAWLATDSLIRRFVGAVVTVGSGLSPREELPFLEPEGEFSARRAGDRVVVDTAAYRRYDPVAETFTALDTRGTAGLYRRLRPLFQKAYRDLGFQEGSFDGAMARAVEELLAVPVPDGPVELEPEGGRGYAYADTGLEGLSPAQKHLLRMGPDNVRRVQAKLEELADALELPVLPVSPGRDTAVRDTAS